MSRASKLSKLVEEDTSYYVLADPKKAEQIVKTGKDDDAEFKGTADDAAKYAKSKLKGKEAVMLKRGADGKFNYAVGESLNGGKNMSRAKDFRKLVESAAINEMYALGADHIVNWLKKVAYEKFDVDPSTVAVVAWPQDGSDFHIQSPLSKDQYDELALKMTRTYPLYAVEFEDGGLMKFYTGRAGGATPEKADDFYPRVEA